MKTNKTNFGKLKVNQNEKTKMVQDMFTEITNNYDLMNDLMSFGTHHLWKKRFFEIINIQPNEKIIDIGSGTADILKLIQKNNIDASVTLVDLNFNMLKYGKNKFKIKKNNINWINCNAEELPFKNNSFDKYIISFCLRNITLIDKAIMEAIRILKPGGSFYCLEFTTPESPIVNNLYKFYKSKIIPIFGNYVAKNKEAYSYLEESISQFPHQDILLAKLNELGFINTTVYSLFNGIVSIHKGYKIK